MIKRCIFLICFVAVLCDFNFAIISDIHIDDKKHPNSIRDARIVIAELNKIVQSDKIRFVVVTGDCTDKATMLPEFKQVFSKLTIPYLVISDLATHLCSH